MRVIVIDSPVKYEKYIIVTENVAWVKLYAEVDEEGDPCTPVIRVQYKSDLVHLLLRGGEQEVDEMNELFSWLLMQLYSDCEHGEDGQIPIFTMGEIDADKKGNGQGKEVKKG